MQPEDSKANIKSAQPKKKQTTKTPLGWQGYLPVK